MSNKLTYSSRLCFLGKHPQFFLSGSSVRIMGFPATGPVVKNPHLTKKGKRIDCHVSNYVPFVVPGLSTRSSTATTPTSSSSSSQDALFDAGRYTENPVPEKSGSTSEELRGDLMHRPTETENKKSEGDEEVQSDPLHELPDWLREFRENLVDERSPSEPRRNPVPKDQDTSSSSHELPMESRAKVALGPGKDSIYTHFPKDQTAISA